MGEGAGGHERHHHRVRTALLVVAGVVVVALGAAGLKLLEDRRADDRLQARLEPFYTPPADLAAGDLGEIVRTQPVTDAPEGARAWRVLYHSQDAAGEPTVTSGVVYAPDEPAPDGGRPLVAWAHGTVGMGDRCAPSRSDPPLPDETWLQTMLDQGWAVTATDYSGLGTPGTLQYLIGQAEANDVAASVIAARSMDEVGAGDRFALWGHSQGGHSVLWTASLAADLLPDVELVAAAAAAPAAELEPLIREQWRDFIAWAIGPEVVVAWPEVYPDVDPDAVLTTAGRTHTEDIANDCILEGAVEGLLRQDVLRQHYFRSDPGGVAAWEAALEDQTVPLPPDGLPVFIAQGTADQVVLPDTTALLVERYCDADVDLTVDWLDGVGHVQSANVAGTTAVGWLGDRFAGRTTNPTCGDPLPVEPATAPDGSAS